MKNFLDGIKDFLYDSIDYIIMIGIVGLVVFIIGWRLDLLFAKDVDDIVPNENIIVENELNEEENPDPSEEIEEEKEAEELEDTTEPIEEGEDEEKEEVNDNSNKATVTLVIPSGSNLSNVASLLESNGLISNKSDFISKAEEMQLATKVKAGNFIINTGSSMEDILKILTK